MSDNQLANIERSLGNVEGTLNALVKEIARDREDAAESRARIYPRVEHAEETTAVAGTIAAQARDKVDALSRVIHEDMKPQTDRLKNLWRRGSGFLAAAALLGGMSQPAFATIVKAIGEFLKAN